MGRLSRGETASPFREAGELCAVEAIDREGLAVTREGALVRFLRAAPKNPLVMSSAEREQVGHAFGQLAGRLQPGDTDINPRAVDYFNRRGTYAIGKAERLLGWRPEVSYEDGMTRTLAWLRAEGHLPRRAPRARRASPGRSAAGCR